jgi:hypothetical protein
MYVIKDHLGGDLEHNINHNGTCHQVTEYKLGILILEALILKQFVT